MIDKTLLNALVDDFISFSKAAVDREAERIAYRTSAALLRKVLDALPDWTNFRPEKPGAYLVCSPERMTPFVVVVAKGQWQKRQNPEWLYVEFDHVCSSTPMSEMPADYSWYGPLAWPSKA